MNSTFLTGLFTDLGLNAETAALFSMASIFLIVLLVTILITLKLRTVIVSLLLKWIHNNNYSFDDLLANNRVINILSWFIPLVVANILLDMLVPADLAIYAIAKRLFKVLSIFLIVLGVNGLFGTIVDIVRIRRPKRAELLKGLVDAGRIACFVLGIIFVVSVLSGVTPWGIVSVLGGLTAVTLLIFKDTILGFVASLQLSMTDMVRVGDWIEMPSYGADGDVIDMSIHTVRVQNWDKTITSIPTYALVSNSFKNWRGMSESGGRRIKRSMLIDISSIRFCDSDMLARFGKIDFLKDYLKQKQEEIEQYNLGLNHEGGDELLINGRRQTNIGVFRAYVVAYLRNIPLISQDMTFLVRQLPPDEKGLPLEIYVFSKEQRWAHYEALQADIFDHLLAALPTFGLRVFQNPSGNDFAKGFRSAPE